MHISQPILDDKDRLILFGAFIALLYIAGTLPAFAQNPVDKRMIQVGENIHVSGETPDRAMVEPQIVAGSTNPNHLLGAAIMASTPSPWAATQDCAAFVSFDGGKTWSTHKLGVQGCGDPWVSVGADGAAYFIALGGAGLLVFRSADAGKTWIDPPISLGRGHDHPTIVADMTGGKFAGTVYVASSRAQHSKDEKLRWPVSVSRSLDNGKIFREPVYITPSNLNLNSDNPVILSDGTLVVPFIDFQHNVDEFNQAGLLERRRTWVITSEDRGEHFSPPLFVSETCGVGFTSLAVDRSSGPLRDRVYSVCANREQNGVYLHHSSDRAEKWSDPVRVHQAQDDITRRIPTVAVNKDGVVAVTWYERVDPSRGCWDIFLAASLDGGQTFLPEVRVSAARSCPENSRNAGAAQRWPAGGDYSGLVATSDGLFHVFWSDSRTGIYQLWTAPVEVDTRAATDR